MTTIHYGSRHSALADLETPRPEDWRTRGGCRDEDPELFFPEESTAHGLVQAREAKAVCGRCPVLEECRRWNIEAGNRWGVWAGTSERDRRQVQGRARAAEAARKKAAIDSGRALALQHGQEVILAHRAGRTEDALAEMFGVGTTAARHALRILCPAGAPGVGATPLERALAHSDTIRVLVRGERTDREIGLFLRFAPQTIADARTVLAHRQAAQVAILETRADRQDAGTVHAGSAVAA